MSFSNSGAGGKPPGGNPPGSPTPGGYPPAGQPSVQPTNPGGYGPPPGQAAPQAPGQAAPFQPAPAAPAFGPSGTVAGFASPLAGHPAAFNPAGNQPPRPAAGAPPPGGPGAPPGGPGAPGAPGWSPQPAPAQPVPQHGGYGAPPASPGGYGAPPPGAGYGVPQPPAPYNAPGAGYGSPPGNPAGFGAPGGGGYGPPPGGGPGGFGPPGGSPPGGYGPPGGGPPGGAPPGGYGPPGGGGPGGYGPPGGGGPGGYGPPGGGGPGGYGPPGGGGPGGYGPPGGGGPGGYGPPGGGGPGGYGSPPGGGGYQPPGGPGGFGPPPGGGYSPPGNFGYGAPPPPPGGGSSGWAPMEAISFAWAWITKDFAGVALPLAVGWFVMLLPQSVLGGARGFTESFLVSSGALDASDIWLVSLIATPISLAVGVVAQAYFLGGIMRFALSVARGKKPEFSDVFAGGATFGAMFVGQLVFSLATMVGTALCVVPGVILALGCQFYGFIIIDKGASGVDALKQSWALTQGHKMNLFVLMLVLVGVAILGALACCVGALLVALPMQMIAQSYVYLKLNAEEPAPAA